MKKGITPIIAVIILLLITVALAGMAWAFLSGYFASMTGQTVQLVGSSCAGTSTVKLVVRNMGTQTISLGCSPAFPGGTTTTATCGSMTIIKATGGNLAGGLDTASLAKDTNVVITDTNCVATACKYNVVTTGMAGSPASNEVTVGPCP